MFSDDPFAGRLFQKMEAALDYLAEQLLLSA